jgi:hypothetical protein
MGNFAFPNLASGDPAPRPAKTSTSRGQVIHAGEEITVTAAQLTLNALFGSIRVPKGAVILGATLKSTDIDTDASPAVVLAVGDTGDDDRLIAGATVGQAAGIDTGVETTGYGYQYTDQTLIQVKVKTIPAAAAAGTLTYGVTYVSP